MEKERPCDIYEMPKIVQRTIFLNNKKINQ